MVSEERIEKAVDWLDELGYPEVVLERGFIKIDSGEEYITIKKSEIADVEIPDDEYTRWVAFTLESSIVKATQDLDIDVPKRIESPLGETLRPLKRLKELGQVRVVMNSEGYIQVERGKILDVRIKGYDL